MRPAVQGLLMQVNPTTYRALVARSSQTVFPIYTSSCLENSDYSQTLHMQMHTSVPPWQCGPTTACFIL